MYQASKTKKSGLDRRKFLRNTLLTGLGAGLSPLALKGETKEENERPENLKFSENEGPQNGIITLLQTTDVHCQIHPHDELFWENNQAVFRKTAGYAHMATLFDLPLGS